MSGHMTGNARLPKANNRRLDRLLTERIHDPYFRRSKPQGTTCCPDCQVVLQAGRWQWMETVPADATPNLCPACQRIRDRVPAGCLTLKGAFFDQHREEILNLVHNKVEQQKTQHPLERLMDVETSEDGGAVITFTAVHLTRAVGDAIERAYMGKLDVQYASGTNMLRVYWERGQ